MNGQHAMFGLQPAPHHQHDPALSELDAANRAAPTLSVAYRACLQAVDAAMGDGATTRHVERLVYPYQQHMTIDEARVWASKVNKVATRLRELEEVGLVETRRDSSGRRLVRLSAGTARRFLVYWITDAGREELAR
jgi:DNA-binding transcriptional ArsR family regulator